MKDGSELRVQKPVSSEWQVMPDIRFSGGDNRIAERTCGCGGCVKVTSLAEFYPGGRVKRVMVS